MIRRPLLGAATVVLQFIATTLQAQDANPDIFCEVSTFNFAWGYQHEGVFIDPDGSIGQYSYAPGNSHWIANDTDTLTREELQEKYRPSRRPIGKVCPDRLLWMRGQLNEVGYSPLSQPVDKGSRDGPTKYTQCWIFHERRVVAQRVVLRIDGDSEAHNLAPAAPALANWIEAVAEDARSRVHIPLKSQGCISYPPSLQEVRDQDLVQSPHMREQAVKALAAAAGLQCHLREQAVSYVEGTNFRQHPSPSQLPNPSSFDFLFDSLDFEKHTGRMVGIDNVLPVQPRVTAIGIVIEDESMGAHGTRVTTVVPYKMGGLNRFPAVMTTIMPNAVGMITTQQVGWCAAIPK